MNPFEAHLRLEDEIANMVDPSDDLYYFFSEMKEACREGFWHNPLGWLHSFTAKIFKRKPRVIYTVEETSVERDGWIVTVDEVYIGPERRHKPRVLQVSMSRVKLIKEKLRYHLMPKTKLTESSHESGSQDPSGILDSLHSIGHHRSLLKKRLSI